MPKVYNRHHGDAPPGAVYVGRGTMWGNPYSHIDYPNTILVETREEAVTQFENRVKDQNLEAVIKANLKGKDLICSCAPKPCHADVLLRIANED